MAFPSSEVRFFPAAHQHDSEPKNLETSDADRFMTSSKAAGSDKDESQQAVFSRESVGQIEPQTK